MLKKAAVAAGVFAVSVASAATFAFAQTATPTTEPTVSPTASPSPTGTQRTVPGGAPATGGGM